MTASRMRRHVTHGMAGLFIVLFALTGMAFTYGLGHPPPLRLCVIHDLGPDAAKPTGAGILAADSAHAPQRSPGFPASDVGLALAVMLSLIVLGLAAVIRRWIVRPKRYGWTLGPPATGLPPPPSLAALQVLRL